jgi:hypothetical protein
MVVKLEHRCNFCYVLPQQPGKPAMIVMPSALQMGWQESPAFFCTATETGWDVIEWLVEQNIPMPQHPSENVMMPDHRPEQ